MTIQPILQESSLLNLSREFEERKKTTGGFGETHSGGRETVQFRDRDLMASDLQEEGRRSMEKDGEPTDEFPVGMRVLAVDDDPTCLKLLENLLLRCQYNGLFSYNLSVFFLLLFLFCFLYITMEKSLVFYRV